MPSLPVPLAFDKLSTIQAIMDEHLFWRMPCCGDSQGAHAQFLC